MERTNVTVTIAMDRNPISSNGNVTRGLTTVLIILITFKTINFSFAEIICENTLMGKDIARLNVSSIMSILAI